ncbi:MAG: hypothetical protein V2I27_14585 [Erythrobacter sp.]|jgi:hypothetical protein|nr:hypothetical protein [Erythrobacter sp.]
MKNLVSGAISVAAVGTLALAAPAISQDNYSAQNKGYSSQQKGDMNSNKSSYDIKAKSPEIVERNNRGKATKVRVEGTVYDVCMTQGQDDCIQPRAAGLNWGDVPLAYWPGDRGNSMR